MRKISRYLRQKQKQKNKNKRQQILGPYVLLMWRVVITYGMSIRCIYLIKFTEQVEAMRRGQLKLERP